MYDRAFSWNNQDIFTGEYINKDLRNVVRVLPVPVFHIPLGKEGEKETCYSVQKLVGNLYIPFEEGMAITLSPFHSSKYSGHLAQLRYQQAGF